MIKKTSGKLSDFLLFVVWGLASLQSVQRIARSTGNVIRYCCLGHCYPRATGANRLQDFGLTLCLLLLVASPPTAAQTARSLLSQVQGVLQDQAPSYQVRLDQLFSKFKAANCAADVRDAHDPNLTVFQRRDASQRVLNCIKTLRTAVALEAAASPDQFVPIDAAFSTLQQQAQGDANEKNAQANFLGLNWGLGFGYSFANDDVIEEATIVNGVVRSSKDKSRQVRLVLEYHKYFWCNRKKTTAKWGCGPFLAVAADEDDLLSGVAVGFMFGRRSKQAKAGEGFSVAIGAIVDADVKSLADGFEENAPPPAGETAVRFEEKSRSSAILFFTRTF